jgi:hypothetical protein
MDVISEVTGETVSLTDNQQLVIKQGIPGNILSMSQETWDAVLEEYGLRDADFPDVEIEEWENIETNTPNPANNEDEINYEPGPKFPPFYLVLILCVALLCIVVFVAIIIGIVFFVRKRSKP